MLEEHHASADSSDEFITPEQPLCQRCSNIDFGQILPVEINPSEAHCCPRHRPTQFRDSTFDTLKKSPPTGVRLGPASEIVKDATCRLCQVFDQTFRQRQSNRAGQDYYLYPFYTSNIYAMAWLHGRKLEGVAETVSFAIIDELDIPRGVFDEYDQLKPKIKTSGWISPLVLSHHAQNFNPRTLGSEVDFGLLKGWLDFCSLKHTGDCAEVPDRSMLPIKLIDCISRTAVMAVPGSPYIALSYVWGHSSISQSNHSCKTETALLPTPLPRVIEDAIIVTQKLGFRYLWIDRYCIDQEDAKDKATQIQQMDLIYSFASCTIVAAAGHDTTVGLPGVSTNGRRPRSSATTRHGCYVSVPPDPVSKIQNSVWNSRGWTFQEGVLSRRLLVFCDDQVYFECERMTCRDAMDKPLVALQQSPCWGDDSTHSYRVDTPSYRLFKRPILDPYPLLECSKLIQIYTKRSMSYPEDILDGVSGILKGVQAVRRSLRLFHGIIVVPDSTSAGSVGAVRRSSFTEELATGLCWDVTMSAKLCRGGQRRPGFPSWSWTGWYQQVKAPPQYEGFIENTHMLRIGVRDMHGIVINWEDHYRRNPTDEGLANVDTRLHIEASFVEVSLYHDATDPRHPDESKPWQSKILWAGLERRDKTVVSTPFAFMPPGGETWPAPYEKFNSVKWQGFIIGRRGAHEEKYGSLTRGCIVLMIVDEGSGVAERLGLATFYNTIELEDVPTRRRSILLG